MKPVEFEEQNTLATSSEPNVEPLPCRIADDQVISCWQLSPEEIEIINNTGRIYVSQLSGGYVIPLFLTADKHDLFIYPNSDSN